MQARALAHAAAAVASLFAAMSPSSSEAWFRRPHYYEPGQKITAHSRFGNGSISSVVRQGPEGWQVRLPQGRWTYCRTSCEETLRVMTVDLTGDPDHSFFNGADGTLARECGIFGCLGGSYEFYF